MQLWLLDFCMLEQERSFARELLPIVRQQCARYLVNTATSSISELSYWRLLFWTTKNDSVRHSVTTINDDCTQINHATVNLNIEIWREGLRTMLDAAREILKNTLLLGLGEAPRFPMDTLIDNPSNLQPGANFIDNPRNGLNVVKDWLFGRLQADVKIKRSFFQSTT